MKASWPYVYVTLVIEVTDAAALKAAALAVPGVPWDDATVAGDDPCLFDSNSAADHVYALLDVAIPGCQVEEINLSEDNQ